MSNLTYYKKTKELILNRAKDYYENNTERLRDQAKHKYRNWCEENKKKKREYGKNRYRNVWRKERKTKRMSKKLSRGQNVSI